MNYRHWYQLVWNCRVDWIRTSDPLQRPGGSLNWLIWDDVFGHVAPMLFVIYLTWGVYYIVTAKDPAKYLSFLNFSMWANLFHGLLMIPMAFSETIYHSKFLTDIPFILIVSITIYAWRPGKIQRSSSVYK